MKFTGRLLSLLLVSAMLLAPVSCDTAAETEETATAATEETAVKKSDEEQLADFIRAYRAGEYKDKMYFQYEDMTEYFTLASYDSIRYPEDELIAETVTDQAVEDYLTTMILNTKVTDEEYTEVTSGPLQKWDVVTIDYKGYMDGEEIDDATAEGEELLLGSGAYIPGFETGLIGQNFDKEIRLDLHFSPYYSAKDKAGKDITFYVTVKKVQRPAIPEITVEVVNELYSTSFKTMDEVKAELKEDMDAAQQSRAHSNISSYLQNDILQRSTVKSYPEKEVNHFTTHFVNYYAQYVEDGSTLADFCEKELGLSYEEFTEKAREYAEEEVAGTLMVLSVCREENITCSDEQLEAMIRGLYENQNGFYGDMRSFLYDYTDIYGADYFELQVKSAAVAEKIRETAVKVTQ